MPVVETVTTPSICVGRQAGLFDGRRRRFDEQLLRGARDRRHCGRASRGAAQYHSMRGDQVALGDAGIVEHPDSRSNRASCRRTLGARSPWRRLLDDMRRNRGGEREEAAGLHASPMSVRQRAEIRFVIGTNWYDPALNARHLCWRWRRAGSSPSATAQAERPFTVTEVATFDSPWAMDFLPGSGVRRDQCRAGHREAGAAVAGRCRNRPKQEVAGVPAVRVEGQGGLLDVVGLAGFRRRPAGLPELYRAVAERQQRRWPRLRAQLTWDRAGAAAGRACTCMWRRPGGRRRRPFSAADRLCAGRASCS